MPFRRSSLAPLLVLLAALSAAPAAAERVPITLRILELVQLDEDFDEGGFPIFGSPATRGDFFVRTESRSVPPPGGPVLVGIADNFEDRCFNPPANIVTPPSNRTLLFTEGGPTDNCENTPWEFGFNPGVGTLVFGNTFRIGIDVLDDDDGDPEGEETVADLDPGPDTRLTLEIPLDGRYRGDVEFPRRCNYGPDRLWPDLTQGEKDALPTGGRAVRICWEVVVPPDSDGDGLLDTWEENGFDGDGDGMVDGEFDVDLPALGADPMHKDLFYEIDWEAGIPPRKASLDEVRAAFAAAPVDAGGVANPDGMPGIDVHFDTGSLTDANGDLVGDPEFAGPLGRGTEIPDGPWIFGTTCFGGLTDGRGCHPVDDPCDQETEGDGLGICEVGFYRAKAEHFEAFPRRFLFRYVIMNVGAGAGQGELGGNDIWLGSSSSATAMHEMGHTLNLSHGGAPEEQGKRNCEPNYLSIMNYRYGRLVRTDGTTHIDFSPASLASGRARAPLAELQEVSLVEDPLDPTDPEHVISFVGPPEVCSALCEGGFRDGARCSADADCENEDDPSMNGICRGVAHERASCTSDAECGGGRCGGRTKSAPVGQPIDWDQDMVRDRVVTQNIDGTFTAGSCGNEGFAAELTMLPESSLTGHDDWGNVRLAFWPSGFSADAPVDPILEPELTDEQIEETLAEISTTDLEIEKRGPPGPLEAETTARLAYELLVSNAGPTLAGAVLVRDELPEGFAVVDLDARCAEVEAGVVDCSTTAFLPGDEASFALEVEGVLACEDGLPPVVQNIARVENASEFAGDDLDPADDVAVLETEVLDTTPPELSLAVSPERLWPPDHRLVAIDVVVETSDACDPDPQVRLVSIESSEPDDGGGDGSTSGDVQGAAFGTDDRQFEVRADRSGKGSGRVYTVTYEAQDASGNATRAEARVAVPHSQAR